MVTRRLRGHHWMQRRGHDAIWKNNSKFSGPTVGHWGIFLIPALLSNLILLQIMSSLLFCDVCKNRCMHTLMHTHAYYWLTPVWVVSLQTYIKRVPGKLEFNLSPFSWFLRAWPPDETLKILFIFYQICQEKSITSFKNKLNNNPFPRKLYLFV